MRSQHWVPSKGEIHWVPYKFFENFGYPKNIFENFGYPKQIQKRNAPPVTSVSTSTYVFFFQEVRGPVIGYFHERVPNGFDIWVPKIFKNIFRVPNDFWVEVLTEVTGGVHYAFGFVLGTQNFQKFLGYPLNIGSKCLLKWRGGVHYVFGFFLGAQNFQK